ncbi:MAG: transcriptional regulator NrdR [Gammaproteobacteria bacterium]|nr:transcriptional regulator NrdR [Gammaproteobacteria bacterium]
MYCPFCHFEETKVIDSRLVVTGDQIRRRRECLSCNERFTTFEVVELSWPRIIKRDGTRSQFDESKLRKGILKSLEKRAVATDVIDAAIHRILSRLRAVAEREVPSSLIGEWVMEELLSLDEVAYVRFASVYKSFEDLEAFRKEIQQLKRRAE